MIIIIILTLCSRHCERELHQEEAYHPVMFLCSKLSGTFRKFSHT